MAPACSRLNSKAARPTAPQPDPRSHARPEPFPLKDYTVGRRVSSSGVRESEHDEV
jgi:hypothetical protein